MRYQAQLERFSFPDDPDNVGEHSFARDELLTSARQLAAEGARQLFLRFGYDLPLDHVQVLQEELYKRS